MVHAMCPSPFSLDGCSAGFSFRVAIQSRGASASLLPRLSDRLDQPPGCDPPSCMRTCVRMEYVELHCHSAYSFLDGASMPDELVPAALELGHGALALTDHNSVSGSMEHAQAARGLGLRAIHGAELDLDDGRHVTLLVEDARGWSNLCRLITRAHAHTREGRPGAPPGDPHVPLEAVLEHADGLVCLSGCARQGVHDEPTAHR